MDMKRRVVLVFLAVLAAAWGLTMISHVQAQQKKGLRFYTYDSSAAGKALCFDSDGQTLVTCTSITMSGAPTVGGLNSTGTITGPAGAFSSTVSGASFTTAGGVTSRGAITGVTGAFSGAVSAASYTTAGGITSGATISGAAGAFTGAVAAGSASLTTPLPVASGGTGTGTLFVTAITSTPTVTGRIAIVGGNAYIATDTTATTDWKQIN